MAFERTVLSKIDVAEAYRDLGLEITGIRPDGNGWLAARGHGRDDQPPTACIAVEGRAKGRYKDRATRESFSLWEFGAVAKRYPDWRACRAAFARKVGVRTPGGKEPARLEDSLAFLPWLGDKARGWCLRVDANITPKALKEAGACLAQYLAGGEHQPGQTVLAFPGYGADGTDADPVGYLIVDAEGELLRLRHKGVAELLLQKEWLIPGSQPCFINRWGVAGLTDAQVVWKVHGINDMLALQSVLREAGPAYEHHVVLVNSSDATERVQPWMARLLAHKVVYLVHDRDRACAGRDAMWETALKGFAREVHRVPLPFPEVPNPFLKVAINGKGLSDCLRLWLKGELPLVPPPPADERAGGMPAESIEEIEDRDIPDYPALLPDDEELPDDALDFGEMPPDEDYLPDDTPDFDEMPPDEEASPDETLDFSEMPPDEEDFPE